jgi:NTP pyrophosphatase (non-canonical NTP hydrolase)
MLKRAVTIRTQFEGIHCWPEAPEEVKFLRKRHRHIFQLRANVEVEHNDRDVEFIMLKHRVDSWLIEKATAETLGENTNKYGLVWHMGRMSCEQVAEEAIGVIQQFVGDQRTITVFVSEDGENEAMVQYVSDWEDCSDLLEDDDDSANRRIAIPVPKQSRVLSLEGYQRQSYVAIQEHENNKEEVMHWAIGLGEEAGEALSVIKHKYYGGKYDIEDLVNELGDTLWHIAALCTACDIRIEDVAEYNLAKLNHRYPTCSFDNDRSVQRHALQEKFKDTDVRKAIMSKILSNN